MQSTAKTLPDSPRASWRFSVLLLASCATGQGTGGDDDQPGAPDAAVGGFVDARPLADARPPADAAPVPDAWLPIDAAESTEITRSSAVTISPVFLKSAPGCTMETWSASFCSSLVKSFCRLTNRIPGTVRSGAKSENRMLRS